MSAKKICLLAVLTAVLIGGKYALYAVWNIEIVTLLLIVYALVLGWRDSLIVCALFILIEIIIAPFTPMWVVLYIIYWPLLVTVVAFLPAQSRKNRVLSDCAEDASVARK